MTTRPRTGVTFWEVLIVLAIISFMIAFLFPIFNGAGTGKRRHGHGSCQSNLKQLGLAYIQYGEDNDGAFPSGVDPTGSGWAGQVYPFSKNIEAYHCPDDPAQGSFVSYTENRNLVAQSLDKLSSPATTTELYENTTLNCDPSITRPPEAVSATGVDAPQTSTRHDAQTHALNFLAVDGHVKSFTPDQVSSEPGAILAKAIAKGHGKAYKLTFSVK